MTIRHLSSLSSRLALALALVLAAQTVAFAQSTKTPQQVQVVNSNAQPVPTAAQGTTNVAGTVNVGNTPDVQVTNTPDVNVANTPTVAVGNEPTVHVGNDANAPVPVRDVNRLPRTPFAIPGSTLMNPGSNVSDAFSFIPSTDKRLVIELFTARGETSTGQTLYATIRCTTNRLVMFYTMALQPLGASQQQGKDEFVATLPVQITCDANTEVQVLFRRNSNLDFQAFNYAEAFTISGHLE